MENLGVVATILALAGAYGFYFRSRSGRLKLRSRNQKLLAHKPLNSTDLGAELGSKATFVQFSSAFCAPCRATKLLLRDVVKEHPGVVHLELDAESQLELVRRLKVKSTPTTLILDPQGREVGRAVGAPRRHQIVAALQAL